MEFKNVTDLSHLSFLKHHDQCSVTWKTEFNETKIKKKGLNHETSTFNEKINFSHKEDDSFDKN